MGLEDLVEDEGENCCPICGKEGEETDNWYMRCDNNNCDTLTWISTDYESGFDPL